MSEESFEKSLTTLSRFFVADRTVLETLDRVAELVTTALPVAEFVGITMMADGRVQTAVFTDPEAPEIDEAQYDVGAGPCLDAFRNGEVCRIDSTADEARWPAFTRSCREHNILSILSVPLTADGVTSGALNLYSKAENGFDVAVVEQACLFAARASIVLANARAYWSARSKAEQLEDALRSRAGIEQAKGIIMSAMRCDPDQAFNVLVEHSKHQGHRLHEIATEIVANVSERPCPPRASSGAVNDRAVEGDKQTAVVGSLTEREAIFQAATIVMVTRSWTRDGAIDYLLDQAQLQRRDLHDVARRIVESHRTFLRLLEHNAAN